MNINFKWWRAFMSWMANPVHAKLFINEGCQIAFTVVGLYGWRHLCLKDNQDHAEVLIVVGSFLLTMSGFNVWAYGKQRDTAVVQDPTEKTKEVKTDGSTTQPAVREGA